MKNPRNGPERARRSTSEPDSLPEVVIETDCSTARRELIAAEAYFLAEQRGFAPGCELDDWLAAERAVDDRLRKTPKDGA